MLDVWYKFVNFEALGSKRQSQPQVSYMIADDNRTFFHVSSKRSAGNTDSDRFFKQVPSLAAPKLTGLYHTSSMST